MNPYVQGQMIRVRDPEDSAKLFVVRVDVVDGEFIEFDDPTIDEQMPCRAHYSDDAILGDHGTLCDTCHSALKQINDSCRKCYAKKHNRPQCVHCTLVLFTDHNRECEHCSDTLCSEHCKEQHEPACEIALAEAARVEDQIEDQYIERAEREGR